jgi:hypothetical protein
MTGRTDGLAAMLATLTDALATWDTRATNRDARPAANQAVDAIDLMVRELHATRERVVDQARVYDDATADRVDAMLARLRAERGL